MAGAPGTPGTEHSAKSSEAGNSKRLLYWAAGLSIGTLFAHALDTPDHLKEWWVYGTFFGVVAAFQFFFGILLFIQPWRYDEEGGVRPDAYRFGRVYYIMGTILNACAIVAYVVSRSISVPRPEPITVLSLVPVAVEAAAGYFLVRLVRQTAAGSARPQASSPTLTPVERPPA